MIKLNKLSGKTMLLICFAVCAGILSIIYGMVRPDRMSLGFLTALFAAMFVWRKLFVWESRDD